MNQKKMLQNSSDFILNHLTPNLKESILIESNWQYLNSKFGHTFSKETQKKLLKKLQKVHFLPFEHIYKQNDANDLALYLIEQGESFLWIYYFIQINKK